MLERGQQRTGASPRQWLLPLVLAFGLLVGVASATPSVELEPYDSQVPTPRQTFFSSPLRPPQLDVAISSNSKAAARDDGQLTFFNYHLRANLSSGPVLMDNDGELVWMHGLRYGAWHVGFQEWKGEKVLTVHAAAYLTFHQFYLLNSSYDQVASVGAVFDSPYAEFNRTDPHEMQITPEGTAIVLHWVPLPADLSIHGGSPRGFKSDTRIQEIDIDTGKVVWEWRVSDHMGLENSCPEIFPRGWQGMTQHYPTPVMYVSGKTGDVLWQIGGKNSSFTHSEGSQFLFQHDARLLSPILPSNVFTMSLFDNASIHPNLTSPEHTARGLILKVDLNKMTVDVHREYKLENMTFVDHQGSMQVLEDGRVLVGWGSRPFFTEFAADGTVIRHKQFATYRAGAPAYRVRKSKWVGRPSTPPDFAFGKDESVGYASWNGATEVKEWALVTGTGESAGSWKGREVGRVKRRGFETSLDLKSLLRGQRQAYPRFFAVAGIDSKTPCLFAAHIDTATWARKGTMFGLIELGQGFINMARASLAPMPIAPDGLTDAEVNAQAPTNRGLLADVFYTAKNGTLNKNGRTVVQGLIQLASGQPLNDRELLLEHGVSLLQSLPPNSAVGSKAANALIGMLWKDLPHPPAAYVGNDSIYRKPDGSSNNRLLPELGKSGTPYSRTVPAVRPKPANLPDPGLVFDCLLKRNEFKPHPSGLSSMFFAFATCVHECFQTNVRDQSINDTTSYVDLSTLYGNNEKEQDSIRTKNGKGTIHNDSLACARLMFMPASVIGVMILFSRNHNHIASRLLQINEKQWYSQDVSKLSPEDQLKQDEDIFQKARNINVGWFASIVLGDYVAAILNTYRADSLWSLNLGGEIKEMGGGRVERGGGNAVSCEFAVLYHWHASLSNGQAQWVEQLFADKIKSPTSEITADEFWGYTGKEIGALRETSPKDWPIHGLKRGADGKFEDRDIANLFKDATAEAAGAFGAHGSPPALKIVEVMGMLQARDKWGVCTMNEFRKYLNLKPFATFEEWNPDPEVAAAARTLYGHVDDLELIGRGILDDAVSLVRSDRFLTHDFNVNTLTSWGLASIQKAPGARGGLLGGLLLTNLPFEFEYNSTYALFPFYTQEAITNILTDLKVFDQYSVSREQARGGHVKSIKTFQACRNIFNDPSKFKVFYNEAILQITENQGFMIGYDDENHNKLKDPFVTAFNPATFSGDIQTYFTTHIQAAVKKSAVPMPNSPTNTCLLDVARDVANVVAVEWVASRFGIPVKTEQNPRGLMTIAELRMMFVGLFVFSSFNSLAGRWLEASRDFGMPLSRRSSRGTAWDDSDDSSQFYQDLMKAKGTLTIDQLAAGCLGLAIPACGNLTQQVTLLVDTILRPEYASEAARIAELALNNDAASDNMLHGYSRVADKAVRVRDGRNVVELDAGQRFIIGTSAAHMDPSAFPDPTKILPNRPKSSYIQLGTGIHECFGEQLSDNALMASIKTIFRLPNLRRAPGRAGSLHPIVSDLAGLEAKTYLDQNSCETPAPVTLQLLFNGNPQTLDIAFKA
ncbi:hypothetical protein MNV49_003941 [Pseudohyphozyma bogoriensis]|nr:hypothetical protein MNV49_003941 [Pseudohyphozyma bogoriensis]